MPFQPRPGGIGRECLQVLCKGWTPIFLTLNSTNFTIESECEAPRATTNFIFVESARRHTDMLITGKL